MRADNLLRPLAVTMSPIYFLLGLIVNSALGEVTVLLGGTDTMHLDRPQDSSVLDDAEVFTGSFLISLKLIIFSKHLLPPKTDFKLMVAQQSGKGPNLKVVKWWKRR